MKILYFGMYDPSYARNSILISGLRKNGAEVIECTDRTKGWRKFLNLYRRHRDLEYDVMIIGFMGHMIVPFAKVISRKPIVFDAFLSLYDSNIFDRKLAGRYSLKAFFYWMLDWLSMHLADRVLLDTQAHIDYVSKTFHVRKDKFARLWIGAQDELFYPREKKEENKFIVLFHGSFIPLQGVPYIRQAVELLKNHPDIEFRFLGQPRIPVAQIPDEIAKADLCLGIFGDTNKTTRVIPNKVYECLAMRKPVITADTPAIRELFTDRDLCLVERANAQQLAEAILSLKSNPDSMKRIADHGYQTVREHAVPAVLGKQLYDYLLRWKF